MVFLVIAIALICVKLPENQYYPVLFLLPILYFHFGRKDSLFLKKIFDQKWRLIILVEYLAVYSLFLMANINYKLNLPELWPILVIFILIFIKPKTHRTTFQLNFIPDFYFEWKSYFRKYFWAVCLGYLILLASAYHPSSLLIGALFFTEFVANIFQPNESKEQLAAFFSRHNLKDKIFFNLRFFNILLLPIVVLFLILNKDQIHFALYYLLFFNAFFLLIITRKYKMYTHKEPQNYFDMGTALEYFFLSATVVPAIFIIVKNFNSTKENIEKYVGNQKSVGMF